MSAEDDSIPVEEIPGAEEAAPESVRSSVTPHTFTKSSDRFRAPNAAESLGEACAKCFRPVYTAEKLLACNKTWHKSCFCCGGAGTEGCGRVLLYGQQMMHFGTQFCKSCHPKVVQTSHAARNVSATGTAIVKSGDRVAEFATLTGTSGTHVSDRAKVFKSPTSPGGPPTPQSAEKRGPSAADKFRAPGAGAALGDRCKACDKMVYTAEKIIAQGVSWHKMCFCCGGKTGKGCGKSLQAGGYEETNGVAYCKNCSRKIHHGDVSTLVSKGAWTGVASPPPAERTRAPSMTSPSTPAAADKPPAAPETTATAESDGDAAAAATSDEGSAAAPTEAAAEAAAEAPETTSASAPEGDSAAAAVAEEPLEGEQAAAEAAQEEGYYAEGQEGAEGYYAESGEGYYAEGQEGYYAEGQEGAEGYYAESGEGYYAEGGEGAEGYAGQEGYEQYQDEHHYGEGEEAAADGTGERTVAYYECPYTSPFDGKGAIYWVGTSGYQIEFENPQVTGLVYVEISTLYRGQLVNLTAYTQQTTAAERIAFATYTNNQPRSWVLVDFGPERRLRPSYYCLKHGASGVGNAVRNWVLEGKADESSDWVMLSKHSKDTALGDEPGAVAGFEITTDAAKSSFFRMFRLTQTGKNSGNNDCLFIGGMEFYGILQVVF